MTWLHCNDSKAKYLKSLKCSIFFVIGAEYARRWTTAGDSCRRSFGIRGSASSDIRTRAVDVEGL